MSGEQSSAEWTTETLRAHLEAVMDERDRRYEQRNTDMERALLAALAASEKAVLKAETATERRFESVNEFRQTLTDQATTFMTRVEAQALLLRVTDRLDLMNETLISTGKREEHRAGKGAGLNAGWVYALGALAALGTLVSLFLLVRPGG